MTALVGAALAVFGLGVLIADGHPFMILWTLLALAVTAYHAHNYFTDGHGAATEIIDISDDPAPRLLAPPPHPPVVAPADKLRELKRLADEGILTPLEYEFKKEEILRSRW